MNRPYSIRTLGDVEPADFYSLLELAFLKTGEPGEIAAARATLELHRTLVASDGMSLVASAGAHSMELTAPGAVVPVAGITTVAVHPAHRRRGLLSALMTRQLTDLAENGEAVAILWASESSIYGRYGYAVACARAAVDARRADTGLVPGAPDTGHLRLEALDLADARDELATLYDRVRTARPGYVARDEKHWSSWLYVPERRSADTMPVRAVLARIDGRVIGYALYAVAFTAGEVTFSGTVQIKELQAADPAAYVALWRFVADLDLTERVTARNMPVDAPVFVLLADPRRIGVVHTDALWSRLVRVGEALGQRMYSAPVDLVLDVIDERCPWNGGRWRLSGDLSGAMCAPTVDTADLTVDAGVLASAYLGESALARYAACGRIIERQPGPIRRLSAAMSWDPRPWCPHTF